MLRVKYAGFNLPLCRKDGYLADMRKMMPSPVVDHPWDSILVPGISPASIEIIDLKAIRNPEQIHSNMRGGRRNLLLAH